MKGYCSLCNFIAFLLTRHDNHCFMSFVYLSKVPISTKKLFGLWQYDKITPQRIQSIVLIFPKLSAVSMQHRQRNKTIEGG